MSNLQRGIASIQLEQMHDLRFTPNSIIEAQEAYKSATGEGKLFDQLITECGDDMAVLRILFWAALRGADKSLIPNFTPEQAGELMAEAANISEVHLAVCVARLRMYGRSEEEIENFTVNLRNLHEAETGEKVRTAEVGLNLFARYQAILQDIETLESISTDGNKSPSSDSTLHLSDSGTKPHSEKSTVSSS